MTNKEMRAQINNCAKSAANSFRLIASDGSKMIDINWGLPYVAIICPDSSEYFFQGEEANNLLEEATNAANKFNVSIENVIIWMAQTW